MKLIAISAIQISPNRQRREFKLDAIQSLSESIQQFGLFHPIVLRLEGDSYVLVSGERRLRAVTDIYELAGSFSHDGSPVEQGCIPYVTLGELSPLAAEEAELEENIRRIDLTWQERATATARLERLRREQRKEAGEPPPTTADISEEVRGSSEGYHQEATRQEIIVAKHLDDPEIRAAASTKDAFKLLKRKENLKRMAALGESVGRTFTADLHQCFNAEAKEWLLAADAEQFDVILTDPPYGVGADSFGDSAGIGGIGGSHGYEDSAENFEALMKVFCPESYRLAKPLAHLYVFCDIDWFIDLRDWFREAGWEVFRTPLIFHKPNAARAPWPDGGPQRQYDLILYARKGKKPVTKLYSDVLVYRPDSNLGHPAQKPVALLIDLLHRSVQPGDSVLDPFCGSGSIFPAAHEMKCKATGIEIDPAAYGIAVKRIELLKAQKELEL